MARLRRPGRRRSDALRLELRARGRAATDEVWDRYARTARWGTWSPQVRATTLPDHLVAGASGDVVGPLRVLVHADVVAVDHVARRWSWTVRLTRPRLPRVVLHLQHRVEAAGPGADGGTSTSLVLSGPGAVVLAYAVPARLALARLVRR